MTDRGASAIERARDNAERVVATAASAKDAVRLIAHLKSSELAREELVLASYLADMNQRIALLRDLARSLGQQDYEATSIVMEHLELARGAKLSVTRLAAELDVL